MGQLKGAFSFYSVSSVRENTKMSYWVEKFDAIADRLKNEETPASVEGISGIALTEFARRDIAVEIYSEVLGCNIWFCSNDKIATQIRKDSQGQVCYTVEELRHLISLNPGPESLIKIHEAKRIFPKGKLNTITKENNDEQK